MEKTMATANCNRRGGSFRSTEPGRSKDINLYMDYKIDKYLAYLDATDNGLYCIEYDEDIPTKEELLEGIDQHNYVDGDGSYRLRQRYIEEEQIRIEREFELKRIAEEKKQEAYEKTPAYLLEVQRKQKELEKKQKELEKKQKELEKKQKKEDKDYWEQYDKIVRRTNNYLDGTPTEEGMTPKLLRSALKEIAEGQEMQLLIELDEEYVKLECLPSEARAHEFQEDAKVNIDKLAKLLRQEGGHMAVDQYTHSLELLCQYINRVKYIKKLMVG